LLEHSDWSQKESKWKVDWSWKENERNNIWERNDETSDWSEEGNKEIDWSDGDRYH